MEGWAQGGVIPPLGKEGEGRAPSSHLVWFGADGDPVLGQMALPLLVRVDHWYIPIPRAASAQTCVEMFLLCMFDLDIVYIAKPRALFGLV